MKLICIPKNQGRKPRRLIWDNKNKSIKELWIAKTNYNNEPQKAILKIEIIDQEVIMREAIEKDNG